MSARSQIKFLLIIHFGLVAYLVLHSILMPLVKSTFAGSSFLNESMLSLLFHLVFFIAMWKHEKLKFFRSIIPFLFYFGVFSTLFNLVLSLQGFTHKGSGDAAFTEIISIGSSLVFFAIFHLNFKKYFKWENWLKSLVLALILTFLSQVGIYYFKSYINGEEKSLQLKALKELKDQKLVYTCLNAEFESDEVIEIKSCGIGPKYIEADSKIIIKNTTEHMEYLRIYRINIKQRSVTQFKRLAISKDKQQVIDITNDSKSSIFVIKSNVKPELGFSILKGDYREMTVEVNQHSFVVQGVRYEF